MLLGSFSLLPCFIEIPVLNANSVDPDHTSDMGLHCLPMSLLWGARHKWVKWIRGYVTCTVHF